MRLVWFVLAKMIGLAPDQSTARPRAPSVPVCSSVRVRLKTQLPLIRSNRWIPAPVLIPGPPPTGRSSATYAAVRSELKTNSLGLELLPVGRNRVGLTAPVADAVEPSQ